MGKATASVLVLGALLLWAPPAAAESPTSAPVTARSLLEGCLSAPSKQSVRQLAVAVGGAPYSEARRRRELKTSTANSPEAATGLDQRTKTTVTDFRGWDLPGPSAGALEYQEERTEIFWVERASGESVTPVRASVAQSCRLNAPVANARAIFEMYEGLTGHPYGIRVSADRRWINVFMFDPDRFDIELSFIFGTPLPGLSPDPEGQDGRLVVSDGGRRFIGGASPGIPTISLTRAALLAGLDQTGTMTFFNMQIQPVVQRLTAQ